MGVIRTAVKFNLNLVFKTIMKNNTVPVVKIKLKSLLVSPKELPLEVCRVSLGGRTFGVLGGFYLKLSSWCKSINVVWKVLLGLPGPCTVKSLLLVPRGLECLGVSLWELPARLGHVTRSPVYLTGPAQPILLRVIWPAPSPWRTVRGLKCPEQPQSWSSVFQQGSESLLSWFEGGVQAALRVAVVLGWESSAVLGGENVEIVKLNMELQDYV